MMKRMLTGCLALALMAAYLMAGTPLWDQFKTAKQNGSEPELPDFSYAGYKYCSTPIPDVSGKVFNVVNYGAVPDDGKSDRTAIRSAIKAAENNNGGIVYFPKGRFLINSKSEFNANPYDAPIKIRKGNIVLRGAGQGQGGTEIFLQHHLLPRPGECLHCAPFMIEWVPYSSTGTLAKITADSRRETFSVTVNSTGSLKTGQWVDLVLDGEADGNYYNFLDPLKLPSRYGGDGIKINEKHQIKSISGNKVTFNEPLHIDVDASFGWTLQRFSPLTGCGVEDIRFRGNYNAAYAKSEGIPFPFVHHRSEYDDGAFSAIRAHNMVDSWIRRCTFTDWNRTVSITGWARSSILGITEDGTMGHYGVQIRKSYGVLYGASKCTAGHWHGMSFMYGSAGTVFWRIELDNTSFDSHARNPYATLIDRCDGTWTEWRNGGSGEGMPHHLRWFVVWNYRNTGASRTFDFWKRESYFVKPIIVGDYGNPMTFVESTVGIHQSAGKKVPEESLFEEQMKLRTGSFPSWLKNLSNGTADRTGPKVVSVEAGAGGNTVTVVFDETVEEASALKAGNYVINNGLSVTGAAFSGDTRTVVLSTSAQKKGITYTISVKNVRDRAETPNTMTAVSKQFSYTACSASTADWISSGIPQQKRAFSMSWTATPEFDNCNALFTLSKAPVKNYPDCAILVRFNKDGLIDARNGGDYQAVNSITYKSGVSYTFSLSVDIPGKTYSVTVKPAGGQETVIADSYGFRTEQATVADLNYWSFIDDLGSFRICDVTLQTAAGMQIIQPEQSLTDKKINTMYTLEGRKSIRQYDTGIYLVRCAGGYKKIIVTR